MSSQQVSSAEMVQFTMQAFRCPWCQTSFESALLLRNHIESMHKKSKDFDKRFVCKACRKIFSFKNNLVRHLKQKPTCLRIYRQKHPESLEEPQQPAPVEPLLSAEGITQNHQEPITPTLSTFQHSASNDSQQGSAAKLNFPSRNAVPESNLNSSSSSECLIIPSQSFDRPLSQEDLNKNERSKKDITTKLHACEDCGKVFNNNVSLWRHKRLRSGCQKADSSARVPTLKNSSPIFDPNEHIITSTTSDGNCVKFYKCPECKKIFQKSHYLKMHMPSHSSLMTCCNVCGKTFANRKSLNVHKKRMHSEGQPENVPSVSIQEVKEDDGSDADASDAVAPLIMTFKCSKCPKEFSSKGFLDQHESTHVYDKLFPCERCGKKYVMWESLKFHVAMNPQCQREDLTSAFQKNMDTSTIFVLNENCGGQTFQCPYCERCFTTISGMKQHMHVHDSFKAFSCKICGSEYACQSGLSNHMKTSQCKEIGKTSSHENTLTSIGRIIRNDFIKAQSAETVSTMAKSEERQGGHTSSPLTSYNVTQAESVELSQCNDVKRSASPLNISTSVSKDTNIITPQFSNSSDCPNDQISIKESPQGSKTTSFDSQRNNASLPSTTATHPSVINIQNQPLPLSGFYNPLNFVSFTQNAGNNFMNHDAHAIGANEINQPSVFTPALSGNPLVYPFNQTQPIPLTGLYNPFTLGSLGQTTASNISHFGVQNQGLGFYPFPNNPLFHQNWGFYQNAGMMIPNLPNFQQSLRESVVQPKTVGSFSIQNILKWPLVWLFNAAWEGVSWF